VCEAAGIDYAEVLVDIPPIPSPMSIEVQVRNHNDLFSLEELSPLTGTLNETRKSQWRMGIYTTPENRKIVEQAAYEVLNIEKITKQDKLII
ncbi:MAG: HD domain-containing protein, partial [Methanomicrobium sp.]|nr:HD domain-containing protein [Methanomicrobium sp.]